MFAAGGIRTRDGGCTRNETDVNTAPEEKPKSRAQRERDAKAYWDSLTEAQEVWALRKMGYFKIGQRV